MTAETIPAEVLDECWCDLVEKTDRTSPEDYPDMALITREELGAYLALADRSTRPAEPAPEVSWHGDDLAVDRFAAAMKAKFSDARAKGKGGWYDETACSQQYLSDELRRHVLKPDPLDVANFAMFLHQRGETIAPAPEVEVGDGEVVAWRWRPDWANGAWAYAGPEDLEPRPAVKVEDLVRLSTLEAERARADRNAERAEEADRLRVEHAMRADAAKAEADELRRENGALSELLKLEGAMRVNERKRGDAAEASLSRALQDRDEAVRVAVEDEHLFWFLYVLNACGKHGASCADDPWEWVGAFCGDFEPTDTFNRAVDMKLAGWSHNSDTDEARTWITDAGKEWLADRARLRADQRAGEGGEA